MRTPGALLLVLSLFVSTANALVVGPEVPVAPPAYVPAPFVAPFTPVVASDGIDYLVLWSTGNLPYETKAAIIAPGGELKTIPQRPLFSDGFSVSNAVWNGSSYLLTVNGDKGIDLARLAADGTLLDAPHLMQPGAFVGPRSLAWNGRNYLLVWDGGAALLTAQGDVVRTIVTPAGTARVVAAGDAFDLFIAGQNAYSVIRVSGAGDVGGSLKMDGTLVDIGTNGSTEIAVTRDPNALMLTAFNVAALSPAPPVRIGGAVDAGSVTIASNGSTFLLGWIAAGAIETMPLDSGGAPTAPAAATCCGNALSLASNGSTYFGAWTSPHEIVGSLFRPDGTAAGQHVLSIAASEETQPARAGSLLVWREATAAGTEILAVRMGANGAIGDPITVSQSNSQDDVAVTFTGSLYFIAWTEQAGGSDTHIVMRRFRTDLTPIDAAPVTVAPAPSSGVALATDGTHALAVWGTAGIAAVRLPDLGNVVDAPVTVVARASSAPRVAWNGSEYLVVWTSGSTCNQFSCPPNGLDVSGARLRPDATPIDTTPLVIATGGPNQIVETVASNGRDFVVGYWSDGPPLGVALHLRHVDPNGTAGPEQTLGDVPFESAIGMPAAVMPLMAIAGNGAGYIVAYQSGSEFQGPVAMHVAHFDDVISGDVVFGMSRDFAEFALQDDSSIVAYTRYAEDPQYGGVQRLFTRTFRSEPRIRLVQR